MRPTRVRVADDLQSPLETILRAQELVRRLGVGDAQRARIPQQFLAGQLLAQLHAQRDVAKQHRFRERAGPVEVRSNGRAALARDRPFTVMTCYARDDLWHVADFLAPAFRINGGAEDEALLADQHPAIGAHLHAIDQGLQARRAEALRSGATVQEAQGQPKDAPSTLGNQQGGGQELQGLAGILAV